jgi:hypothetical protein
MGGTLWNLGLEEGEAPLFVVRGMIEFDWLDIDRFYLAFGFFYWMVQFSVPSSIHFTGFGQVLSMASEK